ncbi:MAG: 30S ribosomal protein S1 [Nitrospira bacterium HGW-Nitrospira-1]|nr:MAG: 30S ribosomal protein S1 [Nitrospira bacterium HGW-Nitrospira-1]
METNNNEMERRYAETFQSVSEGALLAGKIVAIKQNAIIVDIGYKSEGYIRIAEFTEEELKTLKPGSALEVYVENMRDSEGVIRLSKERASKIKTWDILEKSLEEGSEVEGRIIEKIKGGLSVDLGGVKAFLPGSQIDTKIIKDLDSLIGLKLSFRILKINNKRSNVIVSRRAIIEEERALKKVETITKLKEGAVITGAVKNIIDYGVFVDLGGIDGLLHISDISWGRITHPSEFFAVGDEIEVMVLKYDAEKERVTLGYKQKNPDPWLDIEEKYPAGKHITGKVVSITDYGAFMELEEGLEGLVHISEIDWLPRPKHPSKYLSIGETVEAIVLKVDKNERKLSLSLKQLKPSPWELISQRYQPGQKISGKVKSITDFGVFVGLPEGIDGLIHISDLSWVKHVKHPSELVKKGQKIEAVILSIDSANEKIALGLKQLEQDPWIEVIPSTFKLGDEVMGKVLRITDFGIFIEMEGGVEGLIYSSEIVPHSGGEGEEPIKEGDEIKAGIIKIDLEERKIGLSMKHVNPVRDSSLNGIKRTVE